MAGFLALGNDLYVGTLKLNHEAGVENGVFVAPNFANGTATLANATTGDKEVLFVVNEIETIMEDGIDDVDYVVKHGKYLRAHVPQTGEVLVTTKFNGTLVEGDVVAVGVGGAVEKVGTRTPKVKFAVKEKLTAYGKEAVSLIVL